MPLINRVAIIESVYEFAKKEYTELKFCLRVVEQLKFQSRNIVSMTAYELSCQQLMSKNPNSEKCRILKEV